MIDRVQLREASTPPEQLLWLALRNGQIAELYKFRRQHPIGPYVVDFYCHGASLVVEIDGMSHIDRLEQDQERIKYLRQQGLKILRVTNQDVIDELDAVARGIAQAAGVKWE